MKQIPTIGRIVIIHQPDGEQIAAIVTKVYDENCINCSGFLPNGNVSGFSSLNHRSLSGENNTGWDWPERN